MRSEIERLSLRVSASTHVADATMSLLVQGTAGGEEIEASQPVYKTDKRHKCH